MYIIISYLFNCSQITCKYYTCKRCLCPTLYKQFNKVHSLLYKAHFTYNNSINSGYTQDTFSPLTHARLELHGDNPLSANWKYLQTFFSGPDQPFLLEAYRKRPWIGSNLQVTVVV